MLSSEEVLKTDNTRPYLLAHFAKSSIASQFIHFAVKFSAKIIKNVAKSGKSCEFKKRDTNAFSIMVFNLMYLP